MLTSQIPSFISDFVSYYESDLRETNFSDLFFADSNKNYLGSVDNLLFEATNREKNSAKLKLQIKDAILFVLLTPILFLIFLVLLADLFPSILIYDEAGTSRIQSITAVFSIIITIPVSLVIVRTVRKIDTKFELGDLHLKLDENTFSYIKSRLEDENFRLYELNSNSAHFVRGEIIPTIVHHKAIGITLYDTQFLNAHGDTVCVSLKKDRIEIIGDQNIIKQVFEFQIEDNTEKS